MGFAAHRRGLGGAVHWSTIGDPRAPDTEVMAWALTQGHILFTHDLDFGSALALSHAAGPSVLQIRGRHVLPENSAALVVATVWRYEQELQKGALVVVDETDPQTAALRLLVGRQLNSGVRHLAPLDEFRIKIVSYEDR